MLAALVVCAASPSVADDSKVKTDDRRIDRIGLGVEFALRAAIGNIADQNVRKLAAGDVAGTEKATRALIKRLRAEEERLLPSVERLDALRAVYPRAKDRSSFAGDRKALIDAIGDSCRAIWSGTDQLHELIQAQVAARLPALVARGSRSGDPGNYARVWGYYQDLADVGRIRAHICGVTVAEAAAFSRRQEELQRERTRRVRLGWAGAAAAALAAGVACFLFRRRP